MEWGCSTHCYRFSIQTPCAWGRHREPGITMVKSLFTLCAVWIALDDFFFSKPSPPRELSQGIHPDFRWTRWFRLGTLTSERRRPGKFLLQMCSGCLPVVATTFVPVVSPWPDLFWPPTSFSITHRAARRRGWPGHPAHRGIQRCANNTRRTTSFPGQPCAVRERRSSGAARVPTSAWVRTPPGSAACFPGGPGGPRPAAARRRRDGGIPRGPGRARSDPCTPRCG